MFKDYEASQFQKVLQVVTPDGCADDDKLERWWKKGAWGRLVYDGGDWHQRMRT